MLRGGPHRQLRPPTDAILANGSDHLSRFASQTFGCKKTARGGPVFIFRLQKIQLPVSFYLLFFFYSAARRICPLTRSCSADLYQRITAIPRRPPTQKENQIKLYSAHLFSTENYLPEQLRQELGETPTSVGNPAASAAKSEHFRRPNRLSGSNFFPFFLRSSSSSSSRFIPHAASFFCYRSVGLKCFIRLADEAWRLKIPKFNFCGGTPGSPGASGGFRLLFRAKMADITKLAT